MSAKPSHNNASEAPAAPCVIMPQEYIEELRTIKNDVQAVKLAVTGNELYGHKGLASRMTAVERVVAVLAAFLLVIGGERLVKLIF